MLKQKCPNCGSRNYELGDYTDHMAYDDVVDSIGAVDEKDEGFSVWVKCLNCGTEYYINFEITGTELVAKKEE